MPTLSPTPPEFSPKGRYTQERMEGFDKAHQDFWWPEERKLMHHLMAEQNEAFAWTETERGKLREDFFKPVRIATVPHTPWVQGNQPIAPFLFEPVCEQIRSKIEAGVYEPSSSSYRSRWFCVLKKDGKSLRIVHSLEPLNAVTIAHSGLPPNTEELASRFAGRSCGTTMDLYTPFGAMRLVTLPMGWTNSVPIFHEDITAILQPEIPHITEPFVDDVPVKGPLTRAEPIQKLTRKSVQWEWGEEQDKTMADLKKAVEEAPVLKPLDVTSGQPVRLSVDTSYLAVGWYISQRDAIDPNKWNYIRFGSTLLNSTEANYSQAKRELYGIMRALKENEYTLVMARPLVVETDAKYVQGMLQNPGAAPNATINRWIENVRKFYFELSHVMGKTFPADDLSRRRKQPGDPERCEFEEFLDTDPPDPITYSKKLPGGRRSSTF
ncbi:hypothetical protein H1R20_g9797, partial [Candolleomyces eurysporus]